jgi:putative transposase
MAESFFATLECELLARRRFKTQAEARMATFAFIEGFYNPRRRHSALGMRSPIAFERAHAEAAASPGVAKSAAVLATVKDKPPHREAMLRIDGAAEVAVLDRRCARRRGLRVGRDGRMGSAGAACRNWRC